MIEHDKKISGVETPANPVQQQSAPSEGRRRLVKSAIFAVPAIVTLGRNPARAAQESIWCEVTKFTKVQAEDENGNLLFDDDNEPILVDSNEPDSMDSCFMSLGTDAPLV